MIDRLSGEEGAAMRAADLELRDLLELEPRGGCLSLGGQRALLLEGVALGLLRTELIRLLGMAGARGVLTRLGYAQGWGSARALRTALPWDDESEWRRAGGRLCTLVGIAGSEAPSGEGAQAAGPFGESVWRSSHEAEQHLLHQGPADEPVCWMLAGFASGYLSYCLGRDICCVEERCRGKGDAVCTLVGRPREEWGAEVAAQLSPFEAKQELDDALARTTRELERGERDLRSPMPQAALDAPAPDAAGLVAKSDAIQRLLELARRVAKVESTVLITGECGVGKERIARLIHAESPRALGPFIAINCGAVPEGLLESELFGHVKGAFTGATQDRAGLFEAASGGTLLLDEIGEVSAAMQMKLLRTLQEHEVRRVGENESRRVDVRVLAATNRDLVAEVQAARFRQDLYYRLHVVQLRVPPLRERRDDILALARTFLQDAAKRMGSSVTGLTPLAANQLLRYGWPGNVRELQNVLEQAVVLSKGRRIDVGDLPDEVLLAVPLAHATGDVRPLDDVERDYILGVLRMNHGNRAQTAEQLEIGVATLYRKLKQYEASVGKA
jgi:two-component system response regulator HydG